MRNRFSRYATCSSLEVTVSESAAAPGSTEKCIVEAGMILWELQYV
jgi:hypothetical protein